MIEFSDFRPADRRLSDREHFLALRRSAAVLAVGSAVWLAIVCSSSPRPEGRSPTPRVGAVSTERGVPGANPTWEPALRVSRAQAF